MTDADSLLSQIRMGAPHALFKASRALALVAALSLAIAAGSGGYLLGKATGSARCQTSCQARSASPATRHRPIASPTSATAQHSAIASSSASEPTQGWTTHRSSTGYTIQYPPTLQLLSGDGYFDFQLENHDLLARFGTVGLSPIGNPVEYAKNGFCLDGDRGVQELAVNGIVIYRTEHTFTEQDICLDAVILLNEEGRVLDIQGKAFSRDGVVLFDEILTTLQITRQR